MSRRRAYSPDTIAVMARFFAALDAAAESKRIKSVSHYCDAHGIDKRHLYAQRKDLGRGFFEIAWAMPLLRECSLSAEWLLTGEGRMFAKN